MERRKKRRENKEVEDRDKEGGGNEGMGSITSAKTETRQVHVTGVTRELSVPTLTPGVSPISLSTVSHVPSPPH